MRNYLYSHINNYVRSTFVRWACTSNLLYDLDGIFSRMCGASARFYPFSSQMRMVFAMTNYSILLYLTTFEPESINIHSNYHFHIHANAKSVHTFAHLPIWAHWITCCYWLLVLMVILIFKLPWWMEKNHVFKWFYQNILAKHIYGPRTLNCLHYRVICVTNMVQTKWKFLCNILWKLTV